MSKIKHLLESAALVSTEADDAGLWTVCLISEGRGSSGVYSGELLEAYHSAFDNALSFENHPTAEVQARNFKQIVGRVVGETWIEEVDGKKSVYAKYKPDADFKSKLEEYKDVLGLSIFIEGDGREDANGDFLVESFNGDDPFKSVDVVIAAGRGGRFVESLRPIYETRVNDADKTGAASAQDPRQKEDQMTPEQLKELKESIVAAIVESIKPLTEALKVDEDKQLTVEEALTAYDEKVKAIEEAELLPSQVESLKAKAKAGEDVTDAIAEAKKIKDEAAQVAESKTQSTHGRVLGESVSEFGGASAWKVKR